jgi:hypothetical protein
VSGQGQLYIVLGILWVTLSLAGGALLALLACRIHPSFSFRKLWLVYTGILAFSAGLLFAIGVV